jgi:hypothetical protein
VFFNSDTSFDPEGDKLFYEWYLRRGDGDWTAIGTQSNVRRDIETPGSYQVRLVVNDGKLSDETVVSFTVEQGTDGGGGEDDGFLTGPILLLILIIVIVAVAGIAIYVIRTRD